MKRIAKALVAAYVLVAILVAFVPAEAGSLWPFFLVLALLASCTMLVEQQFQYRFVGFAMSALAVGLLVWDFSEGLDFKDQIWEARLKAIEKKGIHAGSA